MSTHPDMDTLLAEIRACRLCEAHLPLGPRPVVQASSTSRLLIVGQAPGRHAHASGLPFDDVSGERLRDWLGVDRAVFHDPRRIAIVPMGFCFPGSGRSGDMPPRPECAPIWHPRLLPLLEKVQLTLLLGRYAQQHMPGRPPGQTLTTTCLAWRDYRKRGMLPLPHPSPRNQAWLKRNPWFQTEVLPWLKARVAALISPRASG